MTYEDREGSVSCQSWALGRVGLWYVQVKTVGPCYSTILSAVQVENYGAANASAFALKTSLQQCARMNI